MFDFDDQETKYVLEPNSSLHLRQSTDSLYGS